MLRILIAGLLLSAAFVPVATAAVDPCERYGVCPIVVVSEDRVCAGLGLGTGGFAACAFPKEGCVSLHFGYRPDLLCLAASAAPVLP